MQDVNENHAPTITTINVNGGSTQIDSVGYTDGQSNYLTNPLATDQDAGQTLTWSIVGGADADKFTISSGSGDGLAQIFWVTPRDLIPNEKSLMAVVVHTTPIMLRYKLMTAMVVSTHKILQSA